MCRQRPPLPLVGFVTEQRPAGDLETRLRKTFRHWGRRAQENVLPLRRADSSDEANDRRCLTIRTSDPAGEECGGNTRMNDLHPARFNLKGGQRCPGIDQHPLRQPPREKAQQVREPSRKVVAGDAIVEMPD